MKRLFTFGCSFTNYVWPTWADIVSQDYDYYENWGENGAGNKHIHSSLIECNQRNNITADDTVMIMWSSQAREDRFLNGKWFTQGSIYNSTYPAEFVDNFTDLTGYLLDTVTYMQSSYDLLTQIGCKQHFFSMMPIDLDFKSNKWMSTVEKIVPAIFTKQSPVISKQILELYAHVIQQVKPSVWETIFNGDWHSRDYHAIGNSNIQETEELERFAEQYNAVAGSSWPAFNDLVDEQDDNVDASVMKEIDEEFDFLTWRHFIKSGRIDHHPTPIEHLEYLDCVKFPVSNKARSFAAHWENQLKTLQFEDKFVWENAVVKRFGV